MSALNPIAGLPPRPAVDASSCRRGRRRGRSPAPSSPGLRPRPLHSILRSGSGRPQAREGCCDCVSSPTSRRGLGSARPFGIAGSIAAARAAVIAYPARSHA